MKYPPGAEVSLNEAVRTTIRTLEEYGHFDTAEEIRRDLGDMLGSEEAFQNVIAFYRAEGNHEAVADIRRVLGRVFPEVFPK